MDKQEYKSKILHEPRKPNGKEWRFFEIGIINVFPAEAENKEPINIAPAIQGLFDAELSKNGGIFSSHFEAKLEDTDLDALLCIDVYGMKCSFQPFFSDLKNYGIVDLFGQEFTKCLLSILCEIGNYMKANTDKPQAVKNKIISMLDACGDVPIVSAVMQISILRGVEMFLQECLDSLDGYGVAEVRNMLDWTMLEEGKLICMFTIMPLTMGLIGHELTEHIKPFTDYLYSTEVGKYANDTTLASLYGGVDNATEEPQQENTLPQVLSTPQAQKILKKAIDANILDTNYKPNNLTQAQMKAFAIGMGIECNFYKKHLKPFEDYWNIKRLAQVKIEAHSEDSIKSIKLLFSHSTRQKMQEIIYGK